MTLTKAKMTNILKSDDEKKATALFKEAYKVKLANIGNKAYFRGIIEFSNICTKNCYYCGIRKDNKNVNRYTMTHDEIVDSAIWAYKNNYGSIVLQSGERNDKQYIDFVSNVLRDIVQQTDGKLGITISLGEQTPDTYQHWFDIGAHRYLLRIETSDMDLYKKLHPADHSFNYRVECLKSLREIGYQVGTGVMMGLPYQTYESMANDVLFFKEIDIDMIGMGPYIVHHDTPLNNTVDNSPEANKRRFTLGLKMIALARLTMPNINIAATTALQSLHPLGREYGLQAGANIIMPNITPRNYRPNYLLYENKPCTDENANDCIKCLENRISMVGESIGYNQWGDSPHYFERKHKQV